MMALTSPEMPVAGAVAAAGLAVGVLVADVAAVAAPNKLAKGFAGVVPAGDVVFVCEVLPGCDVPLVGVEILVLEGVELPRVAAI
jgi:hypothetical protein